MSNELETCDICGSEVVMTDAAKLEEAYDWGGVFFYKELCQTCFEKEKENE